MKFIYASAMLILIAWSHVDKAHSPDSMHMPGAYNMVSVHVKTDSIDTTYTTVKQLKIYTDTYMMYANINPPDSISSFGIATYTSNANGVTENAIFNASDSSTSDQPASFELAIEKTPKGYIQVIKNMSGQHFDLTEAYDAVGTTAKTALDGAWKLINRYWIKGKDTTLAMGIEYKTYYAGHVIRGHVWADSLKKNHTGIGFGTFSLKGNKLKESMSSSTYYEVRNKEFNIDIIMTGKDQFKQTTENGDGSRAVEIYKRLM